jgi:molybdopterin molybdotransferase
MITTAQAEQLIHGCTLSLEQESISIHQAMNRVLSEDLIADTDLPPFNRVMMDGIAVSFRALESGIRSFTVQAMQRAGETPITLENENNCIEIMTGAVCSAGCDTVVPYEHIRIQDGIAHIEIIPNAIGKNIHQKGSDKQRGDVLVAKGSRIGPAEIGIAASIGKASLRIMRLPLVLICSTGDELVEIHETPLAHQIRRSNVYALQASLQTIGIYADSLHLPDELVQLNTALASAIKSYDVILLSGGVSKGKFDLLPKVLSELGIKTILHGIEQRPGKPMWFGRSESCVVFALPGNPVSTLACSARYVLPWFKRQLKLDVTDSWVCVNDKPATHATLNMFIPVQIEHSKEGITAHLLRHQGSGDFSALSGMTGFVEVKAGQSETSRLRYFPL